MLQLIGGEPLVRGGQHIGVILAPDRDRRRGRPVQAGPWLEATGTEPNGIIGLHVRDEMSERSQLAAEMHTRLVSHLEERLAGGEIDPDLLAAADPAACQAHIELQERWMTSALPDGRVPMDVLLDEELFAEWDAADGDALAATRALLDRVGDRPLPPEELSWVGARLRQGIARPGWPGRLLIECSGLHPEDLPADDERLTALGWWGLPGAMLQV
jgi:hypothetical protein